mmetsp:Transcript_4449/g.7477  ORF Transcript_4449/g.7477 Transcript_4449/m.7477 type:complete len:489 (+) Transcript_4449:50-1516(+)
MSQNIFEDNLDDSDSAWSRREAARLKQIQIGKARPEYQRYVREVPPNQRQASHPRTPDPRARVSKRQFDRALGDWRRRLHEFDSVPRRVHDYDAGLWSPTSPGSHKKSSATGAGGSGNRVALNDGRGSAAGVNGQRSSAPRRTRARESKLERSVGKSGGRKPAESQEDSQPQQQQELQQQLQQQTHQQQQQQQHQPQPQPQQQQQPLPPLTQPQEALALSQAGVVRISLADQLLEMPQLSHPPAMDGSWHWYADASYGQDPGAAYGQDPVAYSQESPAYGQEIIDMTWSPEAMQKAMVTPSPKNPQWNERVDGDTPAKDAYAGMPEESMMIPHKLFEDSPEKSCGIEGCLYESSASAQPCLQPGLDMLTDLGAAGQPHLQFQPVAPPPVLTPAPQSLTCPASSNSLTSPAAQGQPSSPRTPKLTPQEVKGLQMSPCTGTPLPTTPRHGHWVPETPSPDRMYSMMQHMMQLPFAHPPSAAFNPYFGMAQ